MRGGLVFGGSRIAIPVAFSLLLGSSGALGLAGRATPDAGREVAEAPKPAEADPWRAFRPLVGRWSGEGSGFGKVSDVDHEWEFAVQGRFLRLHTRAVTRGPGGGEVHEDVGYLSCDQDRSAFVFRQFLSEGFVNTFDVSVDEAASRAIVFGARESESADGMQARMRLEFVSESEYEMVLELATPGQDFSPCQRMRMRKVE